MYKREHCHVKSCLCHVKTWKVQNVTKLSSWRPPQFLMWSRSHPAAGRRCMQMLLNAMALNLELQVLIILRNCSVPHGTRTLKYIFPSNHPFSDPLIRRRVARRAGASRVFLHCPLLGFYIMLFTQVLRLYMINFTFWHKHYIFTW